MKIQFPAARLVAGDKVEINGNVYQADKVDVFCNVITVVFVQGFSAAFAFRENVWLVEAGGNQ